MQPTFGFPLPHWPSQRKSLCYTFLGFGVFAGVRPQPVCTSGWALRPVACLLVYSAFGQASRTLFAVAPPRCNCQNSSACVPQSTKSLIAFRASVLATMVSRCSSITFTASKTAG